MDKTKVEQMLEIIPDPMMEMLAGLKTDSHWAVYVYLLKHNDTKDITVQRISDALGSTAEELKPIIKDLANSGLTSRHAKRISDLPNPDKNYIRVTKLGTDLYGALFDVIIPPSIKEQTTTMTTGELLDLLFTDAEEYIEGSKKSVLRNTHMNELNPSNQIRQDVIDAVVVDFINFVGGKRGVDVGMYTKDLRVKK